MIQRELWTFSVWDEVRNQRWAKGGFGGKELERFTRVYVELLACTSIIEQIADFCSATSDIERDCERSR